MKKLTANKPHKPEWSKHPYGYGYVCHCGYHGKTQAGRAVHNRRAARGLGCSTLGDALKGGAA